MKNEFQKADRSALQKVDLVVQWAEDIVCGVALIIIICVAAAQLVLRYFFSSGLLWGDEVNQALIVAMGMMGCAKAIRTNGHTELTVLTKKPKSLQVRIAIRAVINVISLITLVILFYFSFQYTLSGQTIRSTTLRVPRMYYYMSMPIGLAFSLYEFVRMMKTRIMNDPPEDY